MASKCSSQKCSLFKMPEIHYGWLLRLTGGSACTASCPRYVCIFALRPQSNPHSREALCFTTPSAEERYTTVLQLGQLGVPCLSRVDEEHVPHLCKPLFHGRTWQDLYQWCQLMLRSQRHQCLSPWRKCCRQLEYKTRSISLLRRHQRVKPRTPAVPSNVNQTKSKIKASPKKVIESQCKEVWQLVAPKPEHSPFASPWHFWRGDELPDMARSPCQYQHSYQRSTWRGHAPGQLAYITV